MTRRPKDAKSFTVSVTYNVQNTSSFSCIPKPVLGLLGNPRRITFTMHDDCIAVGGPEEQQSLQGRCEGVPRQTQWCKAAIRRRLPSYILVGRGQHA